MNSSGKNLMLTTEGLSNAERIVWEARAFNALKVGSISGWKAAVNGARLAAKEARDELEGFLASDYTAEDLV